MHEIPKNEKILLKRRKCRVTHSSSEHKVRELVARPGHPDWAVSYVT